MSNLKNVSTYLLFEIGWLTVACDTINEWPEKTMCWVQKCCRCLSLETGSIIIGALTLVASSAFLVLNTMGLVYINMYRQQILDPNSHHETHNHMLPVLLQIKHESLNVIFGILTCFFVAGILSSILLVCGIRKNRPSFVLCFFVFGIFLVISLLLCALLGLLHNLWTLSVMEIIFAMLYIHFLVVVHTVYELMQRGKMFGTNETRILEEDIQEL